MAWSWAGKEIEQAIGQATACQRDKNGLKNGCRARKAACLFATLASIMFSYRHSFHAGNYADVLKHITLVAILRYLISAKDTPLLLVDTHAGAGLYRLDGADAQTSQEAMAAGAARTSRR